MVSTQPVTDKKKTPLERPHKTSRGEIQLSARVSSSNVFCWHYKGTTVYIGKVQCLLCQEGLHDPWCGAKTRHRHFLAFFFSVWYLQKPKHRYKEYLDLQKGVRSFHFLPSMFLRNLEKSHVFTGSKVRWLSFESFEPQEFVAAHFEIPLTRMFCEAFLGLSDHVSAG